MSSSGAYELLPAVSCDPPGTGAAGYLPPAVPASTQRGSVNDCSSTAIADHGCTIPAEVAEEDRNKFVKLVLEEFENLHEGNAIRFGIRPLEFAAWQENAK